MRRTSPTSPTKPASGPKRSSQTPSRPRLTPSHRQTATPEQIEAVRHFNRFYTGLLGLLDEHLLASAFSLTEVRVLYELAHRVDPAGLTASALARDLGLDAAYLSRLLRGFSARGLVERTTSVDDARLQHLRLTPSGKATFKPLQRASQQQVAQLLQALAPAQAVDLVMAMQRIEALLRPQAPAAAMPAVAGGGGAGVGLDGGPAPEHQPQGQRPTRPFVLRPLAVGDIGWITHRQGLLYSREQGWDASFEALVAQIASNFVSNFKPGLENAWVAERGQQIVGSVFCVRVNAREAKLRLLYVEPQARGLGLGQCLTDTCIRFARDSGYQKLSLWTNDVLQAARGIYESRGFVCVKEEPHQSFGKSQVGQYWELDLRPLRQPMKPAAKSQAETTTVAKAKARQKRQPAAA